MKSGRGFTSSPT